MGSNRNTKASYYAVSHGRTRGIFLTWAECEQQVKAFPGAKYQKFQTIAQAEQYLTPTIEPGMTARETPDTSNSKGKKRALFAEPDNADHLVVYTDGACKSNGRSNSVAGVGVWWGHGDPRNIAERCPGDQTNNRAELIAILRVLETTPYSEKRLLILTDSQYSLKCLKEWAPAWEKNGWRTANGQPVKNLPIIQCITDLLNLRDLYGQKVGLDYVKGHSGDIGNDGADAMANKGALLPPVPERDWDALKKKILADSVPVAIRRDHELKAQDQAAEQSVPTKVRKTNSILSPTQTVSGSSTSRGLSAIQSGLMPSPFESNHSFKEALVKSSKKEADQAAAKRLALIEQALNSKPSPGPGPGRVDGSPTRIGYPAMLSSPTRGQATTETTSSHRPSWLPPPVSPESRKKRLDLIEAALSPKKPTAAGSSTSPLSTSSSSKQEDSSRVRLSMIEAALSPKKKSPATSSPTTISTPSSSIHENPSQRPLSMIEVALSPKKQRTVTTSATSSNSINDNLNQRRLSIIEAALSPKKQSAASSSASFMSSPSSSMHEKPARSTSTRSKPIEAVVAHPPYGNDPFDDDPFNDGPSMDDPFHYEPPNDLNDYADCFLDDESLARELAEEF